LIWLVSFVSLGRTGDQRHQIDQKNQRGESCGRLLGLQVVELLNEPLELGHSATALAWSESLIDGEGHGFDGGAHLADAVLIGLGSGVVLIHEHGP